MGLARGTVVALLAGAAFALPAAAEAAYPGANGKLVFVSFRDHVGASEGVRGTPELYLMNPDGSGQTRLTNNALYEQDPVWSPDGTKIAFGANDGLYVMPASGGTPTRVLATAGAVFSPTWAPDGARLAYASGFPTSIYVVAADGTGNTKIADGSWPAWSPRGDTIAFAASGGVWLMKPDGSNQRFLADTPNNRFSWSPDGTRIAGGGKSAIDPNDNNEVWVVGADGTGKRQLTSNNGTTGSEFYGDPAWSPDGASIAFSRGSTEGPEAILVMKADGSYQRVISSSSDGQPDWQPLAAPAPGGNRPPNCAAVTPSTSELWPPNGKARDVFLHGDTADPDGDPVEIFLAGVTQDERTGKGPDAWAGYWSHEVWLRAERNGHGDGRVYRIAFRARDNHGGSCTGEVTVGVPKARHRVAVDSGARYDSLRGQRAGKARHKRWQRARRR